MTTDGDATVLAFTVVGTCTWTVPAGLSNLDAVLIVGGGGGGGMDQGGGGGAGGVVDRTNVAVTPGADLTVVVGAGGAGVVTPNQPNAGTNNGGDSSFSGDVALGGGYGGNGGGNGGSGGSGGGAGYQHDAFTKLGGAALQPGSAAGGLGTTGGNSSFNPSTGGGGGAGGAGGAATASSGGAGGAGVARTITGSVQYYAGGGGGYSDFGAAVVPGGSGIGGSGGRYTTNATDGVANTGSGGGGGATGFRSGGSGGSGIVIIRHGAPSPMITPPPWFQSVGRLSETQACDPGWSPSWAEWMNDRRGGWVCNREILWDSAIGAWSQR